MTRDVEWDDDKQAEVEQARGLTFEAVAAVFFDADRLDWIDARRDYDEERRRTIGMVEGLCITVAYTMRGDVFHISRHGRPTGWKGRNMPRIKFDPAHPPRLSEKTKARFAKMTEDEIEAIASDPLGEHEASTEADLDAAVFVRRLKKLRERFGMSQISMSQVVNVPVGTIRDWEQGRREPEAAALSLLAIFEAEPAAVFRVFNRRTGRSFGEHPSKASELL